MSYLSIKIPNDNFLSKVDNTLLNIYGGHQGRVGLLRKQLR